MNRTERYFDERIGRGEMGHAYLLEAEDGPERLTLARRIAARLLCKNGDGCGMCQACRTVLSGNHPDVITVTHEKPKVISVDEIRRQLVDDMDIRPYRAAYKIYLVDEAEKMNPNAQNALLKTLEEPPAYGVIFLLTANRNAMLPTILSRTVTVNCEKTGGEENEASAGQALLFQYLRRIRALTAAEMAGAAAALKAQTYSPEQTLYDLKRYFRDVLAQKAGAKAAMNFPEESENVRDLAESLPEEALGRLWEDLDEAGKRLSANVSPDTVLEIILLHLRSALRAVRYSEE